MSVTLCYNILCTVITLKTRGQYFSLSFTQMLKFTEKVIFEKAMYIIIILYTCIVLCGACSAVDPLPNYRCR